MAEHKEYEKKEAKFLTGVYAGCQLTRKGESEKGNWELWSTSWICDNDGKTRKISFFTPLKSKKGLKWEEIKQGNTYSVGYSEQEVKNNQGQTFTSRNGFYIALPRAKKEEQKVEMLKDDEVLDIAPSDKGIDTKDVEEFFKVYQRNVAKDKQSKFHFIGAYIANRMPDMSKQIGEVYK